jgi:hypothetical protein
MQHTHIHRNDDETYSDAAGSLVLVQDGKVVCTVSKEQKNSALSAARTICRVLLTDVYVYEITDGAGDIAPGVAVDPAARGWSELYRATPWALQDAMVIGVH